MKVTVLYFAVVRELVGVAEEERELPSEVRTIGDVARYLEGVHGALAGRLGAVRIARNEVFAEGSEGIAEGDVIALIPPVSGG